MSNLQENYINPFDNESLSFQVLKISKVNLVYGLRSIPFRLDGMCSMVLTHGLHVLLM